MGSEPKFVRCGPDLIVNRAEVASVEWDRRHYFNGPGTSHLVITMNHGGQHRVEHTANRALYDAVDCYKIEKELLDA